MVVSLGPGKFYGSSLPRPRYYNRAHEERMDPPVPVLDPLMSHWSMGGVSFTRRRLQGNVEKLRDESLSPPPVPLALKRKRRVIDGDGNEGVLKGLARNLGDEFDKESELVEVIARRTRSRRSEEDVDEVVKSKGDKLNKDLKSVDNGTRTSPRLLKRGSP